MAKIKLIAIVLVLVTVGILPVLAGCTGGGGGTPCSNYTLLIGGGFPLTGPYPEDGLAVLDAYQDYAQYVNDNDQIFPGGPSFPSNITLVVKWADDGASPATATTIYTTFKAQGLKVFRISGSGIATSLINTLLSDSIGATSQASGPYLMTPPRTILANYPIYTDQCAAMADWFITGNATINPNGWNVTHPGGGNYTKPNVAYLTDSTFGLTLLTTEMNNYLTSIGYNLVLPAQVVTGGGAVIDPTTQLTWCVTNNISLTLGAMTTYTSGQLMQYADALGIGTWGTNYTMQVGLCSPSHGVVFVRNYGSRGNGLIVAGSYPAWYDNITNPGVAFCELLQNTYRPGQGVTYNATAYALSHVMYQHGVVEAMIQVDALRLAMLNTGKAPCDLTSSDILNNGFFKITALNTGGIIPTTLTYTIGDIEGAEKVRLDQCVNSTIVNLSLTMPLRHVYHP
jgi:hypothetical protein